MTGRSMSRRSMSRRSMSRRSVTGRNVWVALSVADHVFSIPAASAQATQKGRNPLGAAARNPPPVIRPHP
jgi:hypothetical protein